METATRFITAIRRGDLECWSSGIPRGMTAAAVTAVLATCCAVFAPAVFAQPASDSLWSYWWARQHSVIGAPMLPWFGAKSPTCPRHTPPDRRRIPPGGPETGFRHPEGTA